MMKSLWMILGLGVACVMMSPLEAANPSEAALSMVKTERAFAQMALDSGMTPAFLQYLHDDAVVFRPGPTNGKAWYTENRSGSKAELRWRPIFAEMSSSGDLGLSTGPWEYRSQPGDTNVYFGHFVSVWRRLDDGTFRVMIDLGNSHDKADLPSDIAFGKLATATVNSPGRPQARESLVNELIATETRFSASAGKAMIGKAYAVFADDDIRLYRDGALPYLGKKAAGAVLMPLQEQMTSEPMVFDVSTAGDLGYCYGYQKSWSPADPAKTSRSSYLRVYRKLPGGEWKIFLDIVLPIEE